MNYMFELHVCIIAQCAQAARNAARADSKLGVSSLRRQLFASDDDPQEIKIPDVYTRKNYAHSR